jgi:hypothetical protein
MVTKAAVDSRDHRQCRLLKCLSVKESHQLKAGTEKAIDRAHIFAASAFPDQIYNAANVVTLSRWAHRRMDNYQNPITGEPLELSEHYYWWWRILNHLIADYDENIDYEQLLRDRLIHR